MNCYVCALDGRTAEAIRVVAETGEGVCQGHVLPVLLAGYGVRGLNDTDSVRIAGSRQSDAK